MDAIPHGTIDRVRYRFVAPDKLELKQTHIIFQRKVTTSSTVAVHHSVRLRHFFVRAGDSAKGNRHVFVVYIHVATDDFHRGIYKKKAFRRGPGLVVNIEAGLHGDGVGHVDTKTMDIVVVRRPDNDVLDNLQAAAL